jgi:hypothetical protein
LERFSDIIVDIATHVSIFLCYLGATTLSQASSLSTSLGTAQCFNTREDKLLLSSEYHSLPMEELAPWKQPLLAELYNRIQIGSIHAIPFELLS